MKRFTKIMLFTCVLTIASNVAFASLTAKSTVSVSLGTAKFMVAPENTTGSTATGTKSWTAVNANTDIYFFYKNTGSLTVTAFSWAITHTSGGGGYSIYSCPVGTTFTSATLCSDSSTPVVKGNSGTGPSLTSGQWVPIYINIAAKNDSFRASATVSSSQIRASIISIS